MNNFAGIAFNDENAIEEELLHLSKQRSCFVVTPNVDHVISFHEVESYRKSISHATRILCDSKIIKILSVLRPGKRIKNVIPGSDLTKKIFEENLERFGRILIVGGCSGDVDQLRNKYMYNSIWQMIPPYGLKDSEDKINNCVRQVLEYKVDTIFFAVGSPQQEIIAKKVWQKTNNVRLLCVGASLDFLLEREKRAPTLFQKLSLEWLYRMLSNPRRMVYRYMVRDVKIIKYFLKD